MFTRRDPLSWTRTQHSPLPFHGRSPAAHSPCSSPRQQPEPPLTFIIITLIFKLLYDGLVLLSKPETILIPLRTFVCNFWGLCVGWIEFFSAKWKPNKYCRNHLFHLKSRSQVPSSFHPRSRWGASAQGQSQLSTPEQDPLSVRMFATPQLNHLISCFLLSTNTHYLLLDSLIKHHTAGIPSLHLPPD